MRLRSSLKDWRVPDEGSDMFTLCKKQEGGKKDACEQNVRAFY